MSWIVGIDPFDMLEQGYIVHRVAPAFTAKWCIEADGVGVLSDLVYTDGGEDAVAIYDFEWADEEPSETVFRRTMVEAVNAVDEYLFSVQGMAEED